MPDPDNVIALRPAADRFRPYQPTRTERIGERALLYVAVVVSIGIACAEFYPLWRAVAGWLR